MTTIGSLREEAWGNYPHDNDMAHEHFDAGFTAGVAAEQRFTNPGKRLEALRLAAKIEDLDEEVVRRAALYHRFLTGNLRESGSATASARQAESRPLVFTQVHAARGQAADKASVFAQIMMTVHESGVFADPVLLAAELGRVVTEAKGLGE